MKKYTVSILTTVLLLTAGVAMAATDGGHADPGALLKDFLWRVLNFGVLFALLAFFAVKPIKKGLAGRQEGIEKALEEARKAQKDAEEKFAEYDQKLTKASAEIDELYDSIKREADLERERILTESKEMAAKVKAEAENTASREIAKAKSELQTEAVRLAVDIAQDLLKKEFTSDDQDRLVDEYMKKVGELH